MATTGASDMLIGEAARILACSVQHVRYLEKTGRLRARRVGHLRIFTRQEVEHLAAERYRLQTNQPHWRGEVGEM